MLRVAAIAAAGGLAVALYMLLKRRKQAALLTTETVTAYVAEQLGGSNAVLTPSRPLTATEIGDGNLNYAWCVAEVGDRSRAVFVKQAPGFIKCLGEDFKLGAERLLVESEVLGEYTATAPGLVPAIIARDVQRFTMITEFLHGHELMRTALRSGHGNPRAAADVARFMARTHARTHVKASDAAGAERWSHLTNDSMCGITAEFVFSKPLDAADGTNRCSGGVSEAAAALRADAQLVAAVAALRTTFLTRKECLVHGDLHTGSVMVPAGGADGPAKVIDAEFAHFGCAAFDVGTFVANLLFSRVAAESAADKAQLERMMRDVWATYLASLNGAQPDVLSAAGAVEELCDLTAGFCGIELIRRTIGAAHVDDIEKLEPEARKSRAERACLSVGQLLVREGAKGLRGDRLLVQEFEALVTLAVGMIDGQK